MEEVFVPIALFAIIPLIIWAVSHYRYKAKTNSAEVIKAMIAKDVVVTPEVIKSVGFVPKRTHGDLRTALMLIATGTAFFIFGGFVPDDGGDAQAVFSGLASFPVLIGVALLAFWYFVSRKDEA